MTKAFESSNDLTQWQDAAEHLNRILSHRQGGTLTLGAQETLRQALNRISDACWPTSRYAYTYSRLEAPGLIAACAGKFVSWQAALDAKACFGTAAEVAQIYEAGLRHGAGFNLNIALEWASRARLFCDGLNFSGNPETAEKLFQLGAFASGDNGGWFVRAVEDCGVEMGMVFARNGLREGVIAYQMRQAEGGNKPLLHRQLREVYWEYGRYAVADKETLVERKTLDDNNLTLKVVFNFASRRVSEIYQFNVNTQPPVVHDFSFDDYGPAAIEKARKKLVELGGAPSEDTGILIGKKISIKPLGNGPDKNP